MPDHEKEGHPGRPRDPLFHRHAPAGALVLRRARRHPHLPPGPAAPRRAVPAASRPRNHAGFSRGGGGGAAPGRCRPRLHGRGVAAAHWRSRRPPLRRHHLRRRLSRHPRTCVADPQAARGAGDALHRFGLRRRHRRPVVGGARGRGGGERCACARHRRHRAPLRLQHARGEGRNLRDALRLAARQGGRSRACRRRRG